MFKKDCESEIEKNEILLKDLIARSKELDQEGQSLFQDIELSLKEIEAYITNPKNFNQLEWEHIQTKQQELNTILDRDLQNIRNPQKTKRAFEALNLPRYSIHVR